SEERYKLAARGANDGLWDWDLASGIAFFSPRLHELLEVEEGSLASTMEALFQRLHPEDVKSLRQGLAQRFVRQSQRFEVECRAPRADRGPLWFVLRGLIVYEDGHPRRIVGGLRDITDRKEARMRLVESEARVRAILDNAFDAIITMNEAGLIVEFNAAAARLFGYSREQVVGRLVSETI